MKKMGLMFLAKVAYMGGKKKILKMLFFALNILLGREGRKDK
jgi:hypothetical protein